MATNEQIIGLIKTAEGQQRARRLYGTNKEGRRAAFILPDGPSPSAFSPDPDGANVDGASVARLIYQVRLPSDPPGPPLKNNSRVGMWMSTVWDANALTPTRKASHYSLYVLAKGFCESRDFPQEVSAVVAKAETAAGVQHGKTETSIFVAEHELGYSAEAAEGFGLLTEDGEPIQSEIGAALIDEGAVALPANGKLVVQQQVLVFRGPDIGWDAEPPDDEPPTDPNVDPSVADPQDYYFGYGTAFNNAGPTPGFAAGIVKARKPELGGSCWHHGFYVKKTAVDAFPFRYQKYWGVCAVGFDPKGDGTTVRAMPYMGLGLDVAEAPLHLKGPIPVEQRFEYDGEAGEPYQLGKLSFVGRSSSVGGDTFAATPVEMAEVAVEVTEPGHNAEAAEARIRTVQAGDLEDRLIVGAGVYSPNAVGGDKGPDTLNVKALYVDGFLAEGDDPDDAGVVTATGVVLKKGVPLVRAVAPSDPRLRSVKVYRNAVTDDAAAAFAAGSIGSVDVRAGHKIKWADDADALTSGTDYYYYLSTVTRKQVEGPLTPIGHVVYRAVQGADIEDATLDLAGSKFTGQTPPSRIGALSSDHRCADPYLKDFAGYWQVTNGAPVLVSGTADTAAMNVPNAINFTAAAASTRFQIVQANKPAGGFIEVEAGTNYKCSFVSRVLAGFNGQLRLQVNFYKADQTPCSTATGAISDANYVSAPASLAATTTVAGQISTPADCVYVKFLPLCDWNTNIGVLAAGGALSSNFRMVAKKSSADINAAAIDWTTHVAGSGKPADNATVGATLGSNLKDPGGTTLAMADVHNAAATFAARRRWAFKNSLQGFSLAGGTSALGPLYVTITGNVANQMSLSLTGLSLAGADTYRVRCKVRPRQTMTSSQWSGRCMWTNAIHGFDAVNYRSTLPLPANWAANEWRTLEWDMASPSVGGSDWTSNVITGLLLDFGQASGLIFDIAWIAIGDDGGDGAGLKGIADGADVTGANYSKGSRVDTSGAATNSPPSFYRGLGVTVTHELKNRTALVVSGSAGTGVLTTKVHDATVNGTQIVQHFESADGTFKRRSTLGNDAAWDGWKRVFDEDQKPLAGTDISGLGALALKTTVGAADIDAASATPSVMGPRRLNGLILDPNFADAGYWQCTNGSQIVTGSSGSNALGVANAFQAASTSATASLLQAAANRGNLIPCEPGVTYQVKANTRISASFNGQVQLGLSYFQYDGTASAIKASEVIGGADHTSSPTGAAVNEDLNLTFTTPADCDQIKVVARVNWGANYPGSHSGTGLIGRLRISSSTAYNDTALLAGANVFAGANDFALPPKPTSDNSVTLGSATRRWSQLFAGTTTINTSDAREKTDIGDTPQEVIDVVAALPVSSFRFKDAVAQKGEGARWHYGFTAQAVAEAMAAAGHDPHAYGFYCEDALCESREEIGEDGRPCVVETPMLDDEGRPVTRLGLRLDYLFAIRLEADARRLAALEARIAALEG